MSQNSGFEGILGGLTNLVEKIGELAEKGEQLKRTGEFNFGKDGKGVYGVSVKTGLGDKGDQEIKVEPFGNVRTNQETGEAVVQETREPLTDVFEEEDHILVIAEMPGVSAEDVQVNVQDDVLTISAMRGDKKYHKELLLPARCVKTQIMCNNGVLEIKCLK